MQWLRKRRELMLKKVKNFGGGKSIPTYFKVKHLQQTASAGDVSAEASSLFFGGFFPKKPGTNLVFWALFGSNSCCGGEIWLWRNTSITWMGSQNWIYLYSHIYIYVFFSFFWDISLCIYSNWTPRTSPEAVTSPRVLGLRQDVVNVMLEKNVPIGRKLQLDGIWDEKVSQCTEFNISNLWFSPIRIVCSFGWFLWCLFFFNADSWGNWRWQKRGRKGRRLRCH